MILTTKARYAVMAVIEIAEEKGSQPVSLQAISEKQKISLSYLEQIFARLKKAGIVDSVKGPGGGYTLGKKREEITVADIIRAMGEHVKMTRCSTKEGCVKVSSKCKTHHLWRGLENKIYEYLDSISLTDL
ncbi:MAG: Rrf2 family transcriptional regulator [Proteobacteria bacterium]|nr:Rrf2 family transcriptional regulator [Pseudomonadota bacterium]